MIQIKAFDTPETLLQIVPKTLQENIQFRMDFHQLLSSDESMQNIFLEMCFQKPQLYFNLCCFTFDPRKPRGYKNIPFLLRPAQSDVIDALKEHIDYGKDMLIDKSRDEGATELICKLFAFYWRFEPQCQLLMGSRKAEYVDKGVEITKGQLIGDHKCLMHKVIYGITHWPKWMQPNFYKTFLHLENMDNSAVIDGEATNENFGAGDRQKAVLVDEHGRIEHRMAAAIVDNLPDTTDCTIYNSTHFYGVGHPYNRLLSSTKISVVVLPWERNPVKNKGIYRSPDYDVIEIRDIEHYRSICPEAFDKIHSMEPFKLSEFERDLLTLPADLGRKLKNIKFIADGGDGNEGGWRSVWYDIEEKKRTRRGMAQNVDRNPMGAGDMFFAPAVLRRIGLETIQPARYRGEIQFRLTPQPEVRVKSTRFIKGGRGRFRWWGELINGRPDQSHNYMVCCDIARGTGSSNSVAQIIDVNTGEQVGIWVCPNTTPDAFADQAVAICKWCGG
ncbi:hypothetical protein LCGC14_2398330, partial [marine sediment metagenome]